MNKRVMQRIVFAVLVGIASGCVIDGDEPDDLGDVDQEAINSGGGPGGLPVLLRDCPAEHSTCTGDMRTEYNSCMTRAGFDRFKKALCESVAAAQRTACDQEYRTCNSTK